MIQIHSNILFKKFYNFFNTGRIIFLNVKVATIPFILLFSSFVFFPSFTHAQGLIFSYSYENVTRNNGGGNLETGDTIEVHALAKVNTPTKDFYYTDTISTGTQFITTTSCQSWYRRLKRILRNRQFWCYHRWWYR